MATKKSRTALGATPIEMQTFAMSRRAQQLASPIQRRLNKSDRFPDGFLAAFHECFARYRKPAERTRLLSGISPDRKHGKMSVIDAVLFVCTLAATQLWEGSPSRELRYRFMRQRAPRAKLRPWFSDEEKELHFTRQIEAKKVRALIALAFSQRAGYPTFSRALWRCIDGAIRSDGLGSPPNSIASEETLDAKYESIRNYLFRQYKMQGRATVETEAEAMFLYLHRFLRQRSLGHGRDYALLHASHREP